MDKVIQHRSQSIEYFKQLEYEFQKTEKLYIQKNFSDKLSRNYYPALYCN